MPRAALISWCNITGKIKVLSTLALEADGSQPEDLQIAKPCGYGSADLLVEPDHEGMVKLAKFLQRIAPIMPDGSYRPGPMVDPSTKDIPVTKYLNPSGSRGSGHGRPDKVSYGELDDIIAGLAPKGEE